MAAAGVRVRVDIAVTRGRAVRDEWGGGVVDAAGVHGAWAPSKAREAGDAE